MKATDGVSLTFVGVMVIPGSILVLPYCNYIKHKNLYTCTSECVVQTPNTHKIWLSQLYTMTE